MHDKQVFQDWIFLIDGHDDPLQIRKRQLKANATNAMTLLESKDCALFIFGGDVVIFVKVVDDEWQGR
jgi:hypothetical protein